MKIAVIGANGNIGTRVVKLLLARGITVQALVHGSHTSLPSHEKLTIIQGDIRDKHSVSRAVKGCDAIISTLGSWGTPTKDILTVGMKTLLPLMADHNIKRIVSLTGSGVLLKEDTARWYDYLNPLLLRIIQPKILADGTEHIHLLKKSKTDWTVLRSPIMKNGASQGYSLSKNPPAIWKLAVRDDVALALVEQITSKEYIRQAPFISS